MARPPPPTAVLLDMDGVIAEVKRSYRAAIVQTCAALGVKVTDQMVSEEKLRGNANNDWVLSQRLLKNGGKDVPLPIVTEKFEELYQGTPERPGLRSLETLIPAVGVLEELHRRTKGKMAWSPAAHGRTARSSSATTTSRGSSPCACAWRTGRRSPIRRRCGLRASGSACSPPRR